MTSDRLLEIARQLGVDLEDAETLISDIMPMLQRKSKLLLRAEGGPAAAANVAREILEDELPKVLSNYGLSSLFENRRVLLLAVRMVFPELTDAKAKQMIARMFVSEQPSLSDQLAARLGIRPEHVEDFKNQVIPRLEKYTKSMYRRKIKKNEPIDDIEGFNQFIIENIFIDEFENHPYIRSVTDSQNQAILLPEARVLAIKMIDTWRHAVMAEFG